MSKRNRGDAIGRRGFLKGATVAGAALGAVAPVAAQTPAQARTAAPLSNMAAETMPPPADPSQQSSSGADFMLDVLKTLDSITSPRRRPRPSAACMKRSSITARTRSRKCSAACMKKSRWRWRKPADLAPALKRALAVLRKGGPALVDAIVEPR